MLRVSCGLLLLVLAGCHRPPARDALVAEAQDQVRRFFALTESGDCGALARVMPHPEACEGMVRDFRDSQAHLSAVTAAEVDGRDAHTVLVTVSVPSRKSVHTWIVRAQWTPRGWRIWL